ncbi:MAG: 3D-(3,5/4)-trihydroxycyclohexane-1,2-dione acylhydrolase (decyclizing) [Mitsuokella jalaludinii]|uniref:3D-(3,5/4)-trihydroxycyclohexane-1,2-dione acylhydrolase (decyclizing) n=1 Tax=Mitsuokella jalaludinii TaxID=187979 RepID=UPI0024325050|nr:3D-(3,5/4)-trihydroxycyclohexane-1,2-dione acylhydrolase (decyclizing) [Mitsuokella jalaludinii]MCI6607282.1 3D-(3,5/4)-trihydroxycyclohexane-1,2-dione acylhydrolase (decyclizing) [Mitsuokella jalaludinii]MCI6611383.1 3D-(3,5/4)-trihydroxycyclohexane-1,2-dione acylhydrolase (decyclizing) [Mitsuokella jalaludinii]MCI7063657.1 3D-(3,5/4)-trihydroxycyclohexane-1,2-dione acylhydrolase (decyclizing) [Mitsuokella jalaludinii]MCI7184906.1 3D-(3,5/4)-trihydroxycyclohexane-1,2-dione acylhydrolase (de
MAKTIRLTVAQALVKFLNNQYVEFDGKEVPMFEGIFGIFGHGNVIGIGQALEEDPGHLIMRMGRNEQGMAHAAMGFAKQKRRKQMYACTSSVGPGAANMVTAAATATANCIPVLFLPGDTYADRQPDPVLQQMEQTVSLTTTTNDAFRAVCKYWDRVTRPEVLMTACINAMRVLTDPAETGAVCIALPQDVEGEAWDYPEYFFQKRVHHIDRVKPTERAIEEAVKAIAKAERPLMIFGGGVKYSEAEAVFQKFAEKYGIPFGETQAGKGTITWEHELNMGGVGETGGLAANTLAKDADVVIGVGTRYTDFTTSSKWIFQNPNVQYVNINVSRFHAYKLDGIQVVGDAGAALEMLDEALGKTGYHVSDAYAADIKAAKAAYTKEVERVFHIQFGDNFVPEVNDDFDYKAAEKAYKEAVGETLPQTRVLGLLEEHMDPNGIIVGASGSLPGDLQRVWRPKTVGSYHVEYGFSCMGYEVNAALGVKLAEPQREVYALVGDYAYMMLHSELPTSIAEGKKINVILFDNMQGGCINNLEIGHGQGSYGTEFRFRNEKTGQLDGAYVPVDFAMNAASYGCKSYTAHTEEELIAAIEDAKKQKVSTLIDCKVMPKTMVHGYGDWWRVGVAQVSKSKKIHDCYENLMKPHYDAARKY